VSQTPPVDGLHETRIGFAVDRDGDLFVTLHHTGHAGGPKNLIAQMLIEKVVGFEKEAQGFAAISRRRRDDLGQRLGVIGGDISIGQG
jgi:hypothetical protein